MKSGVDGAVLRLGGVIRVSGLGFAQDFQHKRPEGLEFWGFGGAVPCPGTHMSVGPMS